jgi:hypothetical protein
MSSQRYQSHPELCAVAADSLERTVSAFTGKVYHVMYGAAQGSSIQQLSH